MTAYSRLIFGFNQSAFSTASVRQIVEAAGLLGVDLHGIFLRDPELMGAARLTGLREYRRLGNRMQAFDIAALAETIDAAAKRARDLVESEAAQKKVRSQFEVLTSAVGEAIEAAAKTSDIVVISQPESAFERTSAAYSQLLQAVSHCHAAVLLLPRRGERAGGRILALARNPQDKSIDMARKIAARSHGQSGVEDLHGPHPTQKRHRAKTPAERDRLVVATRQGTNNKLFNDWLELIGERKTPLLLLPEDEKPD